MCLLVVLTVEMEGMVVMLLSPLTRVLMTCEFTGGREVIGQQLEVMEGARRGTGREAKCCCCWCRWGQ